MRFVAYAFVICLAPSAFATTTYLHLSDEVNEESIIPLVDGLENAPHAKGDAVVIEINSPGGETDAGFKLMKAIERFPAKVLCVIDGEADSMASYIYIGCDVRAMTRRSTIMIHEVGAEGGAVGHANDFRNAVDMLTAGTRAAMEHYALHMRGVTAAELVERVRGGRQVWMNWIEAQKMGAVDIVVDKVGDLK